MYNNAVLDSLNFEWGPMCFASGITLYPKESNQGYFSVGVPQGWPGSDQSRNTAALPCLYALRSAVWWGCCRKNSGHFQEWAAQPCRFGDTKRNRILQKFLPLVIGIGFGGKSLQCRVCGVDHHAAGRLAGEKYRRPEHRNKVAGNLFGKQLTRHKGATSNPANFIQFCRRVNHR